MDENFRNITNLQIIGGLLGLFFLGFGFFQMYGQKNEPKAFITRSEPSSATVSALVAPTPAREIMVDISGAVVNPGVYVLEEGQRINDAVLAAGGLVEEADKTFIQREINFAAQVTDEMKLYFPFMGETITQSISQTTKVLGGNLSGKSNSLINLNTATSSELDSLWGIGAARATAIISNRPYQSIEEIVTKASVPQNVFDRIKNQISVK